MKRIFVIGAMLGSLSACGEHAAAIAFVEPGEVEATTTTTKPPPTTLAPTTTIGTRPAGGSRANRGVTRNPAPIRGDKSQGPGDVLERIAKCESGGSYTAQNRHSTASGKYQYLDTTWNNYGGYRHAKDAPPALQDQRARADYARVGTAPWAASRKCWAR